MTKMFSARLEGVNYDRLKELAAQRGVTAARLLNDLLTVILPQMARPEVKFLWLRSDAIGK